MELWDIYDENRNLTGRTIVRGEKLGQNEYHLVVHIWIVNSKGEFLIQKRSPMVKLKPNIWATTGGAVVKGETSYEACIREMSEEIGIAPNMDNAKAIFTIKREDNFSDIWVVKQDFNIEECNIQKEEVSEVKWASIETIKKMIDKDEFWNYKYLDRIFESENKLV